MSEAADANWTDAERRQEVLIAELNHKVRNILGLVRGLIVQSASTAGNVALFVDRLEDRIRSLAQAHDLLTATNWKPTSLQALMRTEIDAYTLAKGRLEFVGPDVMLDPRAFSAMALVLHELVTNARKYGALTTPNGKITIETAFDEIDNVAVTWRETGGPSVSPPTRRGFGSTILEQAIQFEVSGTSVPKFLPTGFVLDMVLPSAVAQAVAPSEPHEPAAEAGARSIDMAAIASLLRSCMVVEDNLFIAIDAEDMLRKLGAGAVEVVRSVSDALALLSARSFTFALLDVKLGEETSLPIAHALEANNIPFAFGTGYDEALAAADIKMNVPIVAKPYHRATMVEALTELIAITTVPSHARDNRA